MIKVKYILFLTVFGLVGFWPLAFAQDLADEATDVEEIRAETEALKGLVKDTKRKLVKQRADNDSKFGKVRKARDVAATKRDQLAEELKKAEEELSFLANEGQSLETEIQRINDETEVLSKDVAEQKQNIAKAKEANLAQKTERDSKQKKIKELHKQQMQLIRESAAAQDKVRLFETQSKEQIEREDAAIRELEKSKAEYVAEKVLLDQKVAAITTQLNSLKKRKETVQREISNAKARSYKLKEEVRTREAELRRAQEELENQVMYDENAN